jgi:hypothetical protein
VEREEEGTLTGGEEQTEKGEKERNLGVKEGEDETEGGITIEEQNEGGERVDLGVGQIEEGGDEVIGGKEQNVGREREGDLGGEEQIKGGREEAGEEMSRTREAERVCRMREEGGTRVERSGRRERRRGVD